MIYERDLISNLFKEIKKLLGNRPKLTITTCFKNKQVQDEKLYSDFSQLEVFKSFFVNYFEDQLSQKLNLNIYQSKIDHQRYFIFSLKSGRQIDLRLDQGVGYWRVKHLEDTYANKVKFPFTSNSNIQVGWVKENHRKISVNSVESFPTDIYISRA